MFAFNASRMKDGISPVETVHFDCFSIRDVNAVTMFFNKGDHPPAV